MNREHAYLIPVAILLTATVIVGGLSAAADPPPPHKWQYLTEQVTHARLRATLKRMGGDGWEVFSIQNTRSVDVKDSASTTSHLHTEMFQVTAKRPAP